MSDLLIATATLGAGALVAYHHAIYPAVAARLGSRVKVSEAPGIDRSALPHLSVVMPAFNEARYIAAKIANLAACDYPRDRLTIWIGCDGCTDGTEIAANRAAAKYPYLNVRIIIFERNRGKVAVVNDLLARAESAVTVFTDVSAKIPENGLVRLASYFADPKVGVVGAGYGIGAEASTGETAYWAYQTAIKRGESVLGGLLGAHGALYAIRTDLFEPLPSEVINDDFVIPLRIAEKGFRTVYDSSVVAVECEAATGRQDFRRRVRIGAGNLQQVLMLWRLLNPFRGGLAFAFASGKVLRVAMPLCMAAAFGGALALAPGNLFFLCLALLQAAGYGIGLAGHAFPGRMPKAARSAGYLLAGYAASIVGMGALAAGRYRRPWRRVADTLENGEKMVNTSSPWDGYPPRLTALAKRAFDITGAVVGLVLSALLFPVLALAIKLESSGPVFFRQLRVGRRLPDRTELFEMIKLRSMRSDAEAASGAVWAQKNDPRVTTVGKFLRKTRLDELPQFINVLRGEMSLIGPRPERPGFYPRLEKAIPYYAERTFGVRPGITGLAQVRQGYDETIEDVRSKVMFDHAYAMSLFSVKSWLRADLEIVGRTLAVMAFGRGQ